MGPPSRWAPVVKLIYCLDGNRELFSTKGGVNHPAKCPQKEVGVTGEEEYRLRKAIAQQPSRIEIR